MKIRKENTIICDGKLELTSDEVDIDLKYDVLGKKLADAAYEDVDGFNMIDRGVYTDNHPIKIAILEKYIAKLKKAGCNYVAIDYNCDHPDYTFCGVDVHQASEEEVNEEIEKDKKKKLYAAEQHLKNIEKSRDVVLKEIEELNK